MRPAPPVSVQATGSGLWRGLHGLLGSLAAAALAAWAGAWWWPESAGPQMWPWLAAVASALVAGAVLGWRGAAEPPRTLTWSGQRWEADGVAGELDVMMDLGRWLLLRLRPSDGSAARWLPLCARRSDGAWHPLRAAVYSRPPESTPPAPPAASRPDQAPD